MVPPAFIFGLGIAWGIGIAIGIIGFLIYHADQVVYPTTMYNRDNEGRYMV